MDTGSIYDYERKIKLSDNSEETFVYGKGSRCDTTIAKIYYDHNNKENKKFEINISNYLELNAITLDDKEKKNEEIVFNIVRDDPLYLPLSKVLIHDSNIVIKDEEIKKSPKFFELIKDNDLIKLKFVNNSKTIINNDRKWNLQINIANLSDTIGDGSKYKLLKALANDIQKVYFDMDKREMEEQRQEKQEKEYAKVMCYPGIQVSGVM